MVGRLLAIDSVFRVLAGRNACQSCADVELARPFHLGLVGAL